MTGDQLAMVSEWMTSGNINQFVMAHPRENRFELVSYPFKLLIPSGPVDDCSILAAGRRCERLDPYARPGNDPR